MTHLWSLRENPKGISTPGPIVELNRHFFFRFFFADVTGVVQISPIIWHLFRFDDACDFYCFRNIWFFFSRILAFLAEQCPFSGPPKRVESRNLASSRIGSAKNWHDLSRVESSRVRTRKHHYCGEWFQSFSLIYHFSPNSQVRRHFLFLKNI